MTNIMLAGFIGLVVSLLGTPVAVRMFRRRGWGQLIREEGPKAHYEKRGTPTMGGLVILIGSVLGYVFGHLGTEGFFPPKDSGLLAIGTIVSLGLLGFIDDF
ncbi:MAG: phospho-N-acetylmuramoyl-pentapeptide-transferase, partial [Actinomycetota bacterium]|nr:phospho-N-acetylmuramoyl-pentapeptide-transferase [Actinomycetota bacterium]